MKNPWKNMKDYRKPVVLCNVPADGDVRRCLEYKDGGAKYNDHMCRYAGRIIGYYCGEAKIRCKKKDAKK